MSNKILTAVITIGTSQDLGHKCIYFIKVPLSSLIPRQISETFTIRIVNMKYYSYWCKCESFDIKNISNTIFTHYSIIRSVDSMPMSEVTPFTIPCIHPSHHAYPKVMVMVMITNEKFKFLLVHVNFYSWHQAISNFEFESQDQGNQHGQRASSHSLPGTQLICFLFISYQSHQQFLRYSYLKNCPWKMRGQSHDLNYGQ